MRNWLLTIAQALFGVAVLSVFVGLIVWQLLPSPDFEKFAAAFGEMAGSVFSAFAFVGLIVTALMQREELGLQRKELRGQREAQQGSEKALQKQVEVSQLTARLNAATTLLEHYRSVQPQSETTEQRVKELLAEVLRLQTMLSDFVETAEFMRFSDELMNMRLVEVGVTELGKIIMGPAVQREQEDGE